MFKKIKVRVRNWYLGEFVKGWTSGGVAYPGGIRRPWVAVKFDWCRKEYKWIITTLIAIAGLLIAYFRF